MRHCSRCMSHGWPNVLIQVPVLPIERRGQTVGGFTNCRKATKAVLEDGGLARSVLRCGEKATVLGISTAVRGRNSPFAWQKNDRMVDLQDPARPRNGQEWVCRIRMVDGMIAQKGHRTLSVVFSYHELTVLGAHGILFA